jgi:two-component system, NarL family, invasion response regulator UvrY
MARVLIADDYPMVRAGLRKLLEEEASITEIGEATSGSETLDRVRSGNWNLVILDLNLPDGGGLDVLRQMRADHPDTVVLVLSNFPEHQYAVHVLGAGAAGYLSKDCAPETLLTAVRTVLQGRRYVSATVRELLLAALNVGKDRPPHSSLSARQFQIFCKIAAGRTVSSLAREMSLSVKTVSTHRTRILMKMGLASNADMTIYALRNALIPYATAAATSVASRDVVLETSS